jgi:aminoglycoside 6'-N-acetyltransferase I
MAEKWLSFKSQSLHEMPTAVEQAAQLLMLAFARYGSWTTMEEARQEVHELLAPGRILRVAVENDEVLGWIGGIPQYDGNVWELHPLVVRPDRQCQGIGTQLVRDFEVQVKERGGLTIQLGTDDVDFQTSLGGVDLYENTWERIRNIRNLKSHPGSQKVRICHHRRARCQRCSKPDIIMGKRV